MFTQPSWRPIGWEDIFSVNEQGPARRAGLRGCLLGAAPSAAVESAKAAFSLAGQLESKLCELSLSLDKSEISATKALESIKALSEHISSVKSDFESNTSGADSPVYSAISAYLSGAASAVDKLLENETASELSPQIKYSYIDAAFLRADMVSSIGKDV